MSDATPNLGLPLIAAAQAQKHVTHNEALSLLDALVQLACLDKDLAAPPASPAEGDRYLVAAPSPAGAWAGLGGQVVRFADGVWTGAVPRPGWFAYVVDEADLYVYDGSAWKSFRRTLTAIVTTGRLGVNTEADPVNRLAVKADAALLSWDDATPGSGDMRVAVNKRADARDAGFVFQTGFSARALLGTLGGDDFSLKVSPDGAAFATALTAAAATGVVAFPQSPTAPTLAAGDSSTRLATTAFVAAAVAPAAPAARRILAGGLATGGGDLAADRTIAVARATPAMAAAGTDDASAVTPLALAGPLAAKVGTARQVAAGAGLTGGGDLSADRTLALAAAGVANAHLAPAPAATIKGNAGASAASPADLTPAQAKGVLGFASAGANADITALAGLTTALSVGQGGTGAATAAGALAALGAAPLASPALSGTPTAPNPPPGTNTAQLATTSFVAASFVTYAYAGATYATATSATLTGTPTAPTPAAGDNSTRLATTAYVDRAAGALTARTQVNDAAYAITAADRTVAVVALTAPRTLVLPAASAYPQGATLLVMDESGACSAATAITLARGGSDTVSGAASAAITAPYGYLALASNGANKWTVVDQAVGMAPAATVAQAAAGSGIQFGILEQLVSLSGASTASAIQIPNRAIVFAVSSRVVTAVTGAPSFGIGVSGNATQFGGSLGTAAGSTNSGVIGPTAFYAPTPLVVTATSGSFTGGAVRLAIHYALFGPPTA